MKWLLLPLFSFIPVIYGYSNSIDSIYTKKELINFLSKNYNKEVNEWGLFRRENELPVKGYEDEYRSNKFYKVDIDQNERTDLIIDGKYLLIVLDLGNKYEVHFLDGGYSSQYSFKKILSLTGLPKMLLLTHFPNSFSKKSIKLIKTDTIIYKFGAFVEYNKIPIHTKIDRISYATSGCYGICPIYNIEISSNNSAVYVAKMYNDTTGNFYGHIDSPKLNEFMNLLDYMNVITLRNRYEVNSTDNPTATLKIIYTDGTVKSISDYGMVGTLGLRRVYELFSDLRKSQRWTQWYSMSSDIDSFILEFRNSFTNTLAWYNGTDYFANDKYYKVKTEASVKNKLDEFKSLTPGDRIITLNPDNSFVFTYNDSRYKNTCKLSIGKWSQLNDSTIVLNWSGISTLNTIRHQELYQKYFSEKNNIPSPMRIENWTFIYSHDRKILHPLKESD